MEMKHARTYEEASETLQDLKRRLGEGGYVYRIVPSRYQGYDVMAIDFDLFVDIVAGGAIDGIPVPILNLGARTLGGEA